MALGLAVPTNFGVSCDYWRVDGLYYDARNEIMRVSMHLYHDAAAAGEGKLSMREEAFAIENVTLADMAAKNPVKLAYERVKQLPFFAGAADV